MQEIINVINDNNKISKLLSFETQIFHENVRDLVMKYRDYIKWSQLLLDENAQSLKQFEIHNLLIRACLFGKGEMVRKLLNDYFENKED